MVVMSILEANKIHALVINNPFDCEDVTPITLDSEGKTLSQLMEGVNTECLVSLNGRYIAKTDFDSVIPTSHDALVVSVVPASGDGAKTVLRIAAFVALSYFTFGGGGASFWANFGTGFTAFAAKTAVFIGGSLLINELLPPVLPEIPDQSLAASPSQTYGIDGPKNTSREDIPVPIVFGGYRIAANFINTRTINKGDSQSLFLLINAGEGEIQGISDIRVNNEPYESFDAKVYTRIGSNNQEIIEEFSDASVDTNIGITLEDRGDSATSSTSLDATKIEFDIVFNQGLFSLTQEGKYINATVYFLAMYRVKNAVDNIWYSVADELKQPCIYAEVHSGSGSTENIIDYILIPTSKIVMADDFNGDFSVFDAFHSTYETKSVGGGADRDEYGGDQERLYEYTIRGVIGEEKTVIGVATFEEYQLDTGDFVYRVTGNDASVRRLTYASPQLDLNDYEFQIVRKTIKPDNSNPDRTNTVRNSFTLSNFREFRGVEGIAYNNTALVGVEVTVDNQINSLPLITFYNEGILIPVYRRDTTDPSNFNATLEASDNPAWIVYAMYTNERWGAGKSVDRFSIEEIYEWAEICEQNGWKFHGVFDSRMDILEAARAVEKVGRGKVIPMGNRYSVNVNVPKQMSQLFTSSSMDVGSLEISWLPTTDRANVIDCTFYDKENDNKPRTFRYYNDNIIEKGHPFRPTELNLFGVDNYEQAVKECIFALNFNQLSQTISFDASIDAIACRVGQVIGVQHDMPAWGQGGRIEAASTTRVINLDRAVTMNAGVQYFVLIHFNAKTLESISVSAHPASPHTVISATEPNQEADRIIIDDIDYKIESVVFDSSNNRYAIILDDIISLSGGEQAQLVRSDATISKRVVTVEGESTVLALHADEDDFHTAPEHLMQFSFGEEQKQVKKFIVTNISGSGVETRTITGLEYYEEALSDTLIDSLVNFSTFPDIVYTPQDLHVQELVYGNTTLKNIKLVLSWQYDNSNPIQKANVYLKFADGVQMRLASGVGNTVDINDTFEFDDQLTFVVIPVNQHGIEAKQHAAELSYTIQTYLRYPPVEQLIGSLENNAVNLYWQRGENESFVNAIFRYEVWEACTDIGQPTPIWPDDFTKNNTTMERYARIENLDVSKAYTFAVVTVNPLYTEIISEPLFFDVQTPATFYHRVAPSGIELWYSEGVDESTTLGNPDTHPENWTMEFSDSAVVQAVITWTNFIFQPWAITPIASSSVGMNYLGELPAYPSPADEGDLFLYTVNNAYYVRRNGQWVLFLDRNVSGLSVQYSPNGVQDDTDASYNWSSTFRVGIDKFMRQSTDSGLNWSDSILIVGEAGIDGKYRDYKFARAETQPSLDPTNTDPSGWSDAPPSEGGYLWMIVVEKNADGSFYNGQTWGAPTRLSGENGADGADGQNAIIYKIHYPNGTAIKNGLNTVTLNVARADGGALSIVSGDGHPQLYDGSTLLGLSKTFDKDDINGSKIIQLKDGGTVLDSVTITDVLDGENAVTPSASYDNVLSWVKNSNTGEWSTNNYTTVYKVDFYKLGVKIASRTITAVLNESAGTISLTSTASEGQSTSFSVIKNSSSAPTLIVNHLGSNTFTTETFHAIIGGEKGIDGDSSIFFNNFDSQDAYDEIVAKSGTSSLWSTTHYSGTHSALLKSYKSSATSLTTGNGETIYITIPERLALMFANQTVTVSVIAKSGAVVPSKFALAYSTSDVGNSGWIEFTPTSSWEKYSFEYFVPHPSSGSTDFLIINPDVDGAGGEIYLDDVIISIKGEKGEDGTDGVDGISAYSMALEKDSTAIILDELGEPISLPSNEVTVLFGDIDDTSNWSIIAAAVNCTGVLSDNTYQLTSINNSIENALVSFIASKEGLPNIKKVWSLSTLQKSDIAILPQQVIANPLTDWKFTDDNLQGFNTDQLIVESGKNAIKLTGASDASNAYISTPSLNVIGSSLYAFSIRIRCTNASIKGSCQLYYKNVNHSFNNSFKIEQSVVYKQGQWVTLTFNLAELTVGDDYDYLTNIVQQIRFDFLNGPDIADKEFEIDYISMGVFGAADKTNYSDGRISNDEVTTEQLKKAARWTILPVDGANKTLLSGGGGEGRMQFQLNDGVWTTVDVYSATEREKIGYLTSGKTPNGSKDLLDTDLSFLTSAGLSAIGLEATSKINQLRPDASYKNDNIQPANNWGGKNLELSGQSVAWVRNHVSEVPPTGEDGKIIINSTNGGSGYLHLKAVDPEGNIRVSLNGVKVGTMSGPNNEVKWYTFKVNNLVAGNNTVYTWAHNSDGGAVRAWAVTGSSVGDPESIINTSVELTNYRADQRIAVLRPESEYKNSQLTEEDIKTGANWSVLPDSGATKVVSLADSVQGRMKLEISGVTKTIDVFTSDARTQIDRLRSGKLPDNSGDILDRNLSKLTSTGQSTIDGRANSRVAALRPDSNYKNSNLTTTDIRTGANWTTLPDDGATRVSTLTDTTEGRMKLQISGVSHTVDVFSSDARTQINRLRAGKLPDGDDQYILDRNMARLNSTGQSVIDGRANNRVIALRPDSTYKNSNLTETDIRSGANWSQLPDDGATRVSTLTDSTEGRMKLQISGVTKTVDVFSSGARTQIDRLRSGKMPNNSALSIIDHDSAKSLADTAEANAKQIKASANLLDVSDTLLAWQKDWTKKNYAQVLDNRGQSDNWRYQNGPMLEVRRSISETTGEQDNISYSKLVPVEEGERYCFHVRIGAHRAHFGLRYKIFYEDGSSTVTNKTFDGYSYSPRLSNGKFKKSYNLASYILDMPLNAVAVQPHIVMYNAAASVTTTSHLFVIEWCLNKIAPGSNIVPEYSPPTPIDINNFGFVGALDANKTEIDGGGSEGQMRFKTNNESWINIDVFSSAERQKLDNLRQGRMPSDSGKYLIDRDDAQGRVDTAKNDLENQVSATKEDLQKQNAQTQNSAGILPDPTFRNFVHSDTPIENYFSIWGGNNVDRTHVYRDGGDLIIKRLDNSAYDSGLGFKSNGYTVYVPVSKGDKFHCRLDFTPLNGGNNLRIELTPRDANYANTTGYNDMITGAMSNTASGRTVLEGTATVTDENTQFVGFSLIIPKGAGAKYYRIHSIQFTRVVSSMDNNKLTTEDVRTGANWSELPSSGANKTQLDSGTTEGRMRYKTNDGGWNYVDVYTSASRQQINNLRAGKLPNGSKPLMDSDLSLMTSTAQNTIDSRANNRINSLRPDASYKNDNIQPANNWGAKKLTTNISWARGHNSESPPTGTDGKLIITSLHGGTGFVHLKAVDAEGDIRVSLNGTQVGKMSGENNETKWYSFKVFNLVAGNNTVYVWSKGQDGGAVISWVITGNAVGDPEAILMSSTEVVEQSAESRIQALRPDSAYRNSNLTQTDIRTGAGWSTLPADGANKTELGSGGGEGRVQYRNNNGSWVTIEAYSTNARTEIDRLRSGRDPDTNQELFHRGRKPSQSDVGLPNTPNKTEAQLNSSAIAAAKNDSLLHNTSGDGINRFPVEYNNPVQGVPMNSVTRTSLSISTWDGHGFPSERAFYMEATGSDAYMYFCKSWSDYNIPLVRGKKWIISAWIRTTTNHSGKTGSFFFLFKDSAGVNRHNGAHFTLPNAYTSKRVSVVIDMTSTTNNRNEARWASLRIDNEGGAGCGIIIDQIMIEEDIYGKGLPSPYTPSAKSSLLTSKAGLSMNTAVNASASVTPVNPLYISIFTTSSTGKISIRAHTLHTVNGDVSYNAGEITGLSFDTRYYVYCNDPYFLGGSVTYYAVRDTSAGTVTNTLGNRLIGSITTPTSSGAAPAEPATDAGSPKQNTI